MSSIYKALSLLKCDVLVNRLTSRYLKILMYHGIVGDDENTECWWLLKKSKFEEQIKYISKNYSVISINEAVKVLLDPRLKFNNHVVITFDDGYANFLSNAVPILERHNLPSTVYIPTGPVENDGLIWIDKIYYSICHSKDEYINLEDIGLGSRRIGSKIDRTKFAKDVTNKLKFIPKENREDKVAILSKRLPFIPQETNPFKLLSKSDVKKMSQMPLVTIGAHTMSHEILTSMPFDSAVNEISGSKKKLEEWLERSVNHFAYPNGNYNNRIKDQLGRIGFISAVTNSDFFVQRTNIFELPRLGVGAWDDMGFFRCLISGVIATGKIVKSFYR